MKGKHTEKLMECEDRWINLINSLSYIVASDKHVSHEAYSTSQCRDSAVSAVRQISSKSPLPSGKHVATTLGCSNIFWTNIVNMECNRRRGYSQK